jgi:hypothetical protein
VARFTSGGGVHARDQRGYDPLHLPAEVRRIGPAGDDQVVDGAQKGERQRLGVGAGSDPAQFLLGVKVVGEMPLDVTEPGLAARGMPQIPRGVTALPYPPCSPCSPCSPWPPRSPPLAVTSLEAARVRGAAPQK